MEALRRKINLLSAVAAPCQLLDTNPARKPQGLCNIFRRTEHRTRTQWRCVYETTWNWGGGARAPGVHRQLSRGPERGDLGLQGASVPGSWAPQTPKALRSRTLPAARAQTAPPRPRDALAKPIGRRFARLTHVTPHVMRHVTRPGSYELGLVERERPERAGRVCARRWRRHVHGGGGESAPPGQVPAPFPRGAWW